ncbi:Zn(II)2Cys6 transcription factor domain-containing protein [Aspergillus affinis]|uniref:Zn(II)2Cys6 transcription factor domain-containing protein n=1 Tax=Aspergillus affinis TaxID=1070780 RepID=UPI0022FE62A3|nr:uncharacterized protein KD926_006062 [Aspergillus affinis]KAI9042143.1 hypothetical protein KD926_006062 [Aspergillus affinis]
MPLEVSGLGRFRLPSAPKRKASADTRAKDSRRRRPHAKSRSGCFSCKESRVKCNEARPKCQRCSVRRKSCSYDTLSVPLPNDCRMVATVSSSLVECGYDQIRHGPYEGMHNGSVMTPDAYLARNFDHCVDTSFASEAGKVIAKRFLLPGCAATPMLMHALLALSARNIQYLHPTGRSHELAFRYHAQEASGLLNRVIQEGVDAHNIELVYATCLVINMVAFTSREDTMLQSWVFKEDEASITESSVWYMIQEGMGYLSHVLKQSFHQTFWRLKSDFGDVPPLTLFCVTAGGSASERRSRIPSILADVCQVTSQSTPENNAYYVPLELLSYLFGLTRDNANSLDSILAFGPRVSHEYRMLVRQKDEPALLLFMLWLRLLCGEVYWWVTARARSEYAAVSWLLGQSEDVRIRTIARDPDLVLRSLEDNEEYHL